ncbi:GNAT family N-acetyltransferase [Sphingomonas quercus]|uniref:GNAT family N-acetyltransferase n=1 Tax=Sphingomonas quercus TaxID=2842451 RepID=A0ABS6BII4_9SPHN|nr:GNAT family N-acetyltransferase [Sphingomonas quercus]
MTEAATIRAATADDVAAIAAIYAHHVLHGTGTFEEVPPDAAGMGGRFAAVAARGWPWLVATDADGAVIGYAYAAQFRDRAAYRYACEDSVYVAPGAMGAGVGAALMAALIPAARAAGFRRMIAVIGDSANLGSIALHRRFGFTDAGRLDEAGFKFGRWVDVVFMQAAI